MDVSVAIGTYGGPEWVDLARMRAIPSVPPGVPVIHEHGVTLARARNAALARVETEWVVHLDADDELEPGYLEAMCCTGTAALRAPSVRYIQPGIRLPEPVMPKVAGHQHTCLPSCLRDGNWLVVGTMIRTSLARAVGGWEEWPWSEDWALWARCWRAGATIEAIPEAVYRAHVRARSRNRGNSRAERLATHRAIEAAVWPEGVLV